MKKDAKNAIAPRKVVNRKVAFQSYLSAMTVPIGTPITFASVKPPKTNDIASPRFAIGMFSLATIIAREIKTPVTIAVIIRSARSMT